MQNEACGVTFMLNSKILIAQYAKSNAARAASPAAYDKRRERDFTQRHRLGSGLVVQLDYANWKDFGKISLWELKILKNNKTPSLQILNFLRRCLCAHFINLTMSTSRRLAA